MSYTELMAQVAEFVVNAPDSEQIEYQTVVHTTRMPWRQIRAQVQRGHDTADLVPGFMAHSGDPSIKVWVSKADVPTVRKDQDRVRLAALDGSGALEYRVMEIIDNHFAGWELYCAR